MTVHALRACAAATALAGVAAAPAHADLDRLPGEYRVEGADETCRLRLDAPARAPEDSRLVAETFSGLVLAFPGCPAGLSEVMLWRAPADGSSLALIDGAGAVIAAFDPAENGDWTVSGAATADLALRRD
ncbi:MAG: hypothetical protein ACLFQ5_00955 [Oceanicaulis sp.]